MCVVDKTREVRGELVNIGEVDIARDDETRCLIAVCSGVLSHLFGHRSPAGSGQLKTPLVAGSSCPDRSGRIQSPPRTRCHRSCAAVAIRSACHGEQPQPRPGGATTLDATATRFACAGPCPARGHVRSHEGSRAASYPRRRAVTLPVSRMHVLKRAGDHRASVGENDAIDRPSAKPQVTTALYPVRRRRGAGGRHRRSGAAWLRERGNSHPQQETWPTPARRRNLESRSRSGGSGGHQDARHTRGRSWASP